MSNIEDIEVGDKVRFVKGSTMHRNYGDGVMSVIEASVAGCTAQDLAGVVYYALWHEVELVGDAPRMPRAPKAGQS